MKYLIIGGDHPRHLHYLNSIVNNCNVVGAILEKRENFIPTPPNNLEQRDYNNFIKHFSNREKFEIEYFGKEKVFPECPIQYVEEDTLSLMQSVKFVNNLKPDVVFIFGTRMIGESLLRLVGKKGYFKYLQQTTEAEFFTKQSKYLTFTDFWQKRIL